MIDCGDEYMFACDECPIVEDLERRLNIADEYGILQLEYCGCDKVGGEFYCCGYCGDAFYDNRSRGNHGKRKTGRAYRRDATTKKRNALIGKIKSANVRNAWVKYGWKDGEYVPVGNYIMRPKNSNRQKYWKKYSNKVVRRSNMFYGGKAGYRRAFDYWWTVD